jgi:hypothetical protein
MSIGSPLVAQNCRSGMSASSVTMVANRTYSRVGSISQWHPDPLAVMAQNDRRHGQQLTLRGANRAGHKAEPDQRTVLAASMSALGGNGRAAAKEGGRA